MSCVADRIKTKLGGTYLLTLISKMVQDGNKSKIY